MSAFHTDPSITLRGLQQPESPTEILTNFAKLKNMSQQNQTGQMQLDEEKKQMSERNALDSLLVKQTQMNSKDPYGDALNEGVQSGAIRPTTAMRLKSTLTETMGKMSDEQRKRKMEMTDRQNNILGAIRSIPAEDVPARQQAIQTAIQQLSSEGSMSPDQANQITQSVGQINDPTQLDQQLEIYQAHAVGMKALFERETEIKKFQMEKRGMPLNPDEIATRNRMLTDRFQVLNPGKTLPPQYTLGGAATDKTYEQVDKALGQVENAGATQEQRKMVNAIRQQTFEMAKHKQDVGDQAIEIAAQSLASGDLSRLRDITGLRNDQRLVVFAKAKQLNPTFNIAKVDRQIKMMELYTTGKQGDQLQSFGTFLEHAGALTDVVQQLGKSPVLGAIANHSWNWLRAHASDYPEYARVLAALDPVQKEFETYLLNNRALYTEDRANVEKIINPDTPLNASFAAIGQMGHTVVARYNESDKRFRNTMGGKGIEEMIGPLSDEAKAAAAKIGVTIGGSNMVRMMAPDGTEADVPREQVQAAKAAGAKVKQ